MSTIKITVTRYNPEKSSERYTQSYTIPYKEDMVVLDGLNYIKNHVDGTLTHRWSCRMEASCSILKRAQEEEHRCWQDETCS